MTDTNHDVETIGASADVDSSRDESGDSEQTAERPDSRVPHQDRRPPIGEGTHERVTARTGTGTRRRFLAAVSAASAALAGCPGGSATDETDTPMPEASETRTPTAAETATPEPAPTPTATPTPQPVSGVRIPGAALTELGLGAVEFEDVTVDEGGE